MNAARLRQRDLARIHLVKKQLGLDDETYRELLVGLTGKSSAADMTNQERWTVIREMSHLRAQTPQQCRPEPPPTPRQEKARLLYKIESLLGERERPEEYANALAKHMFKVDLIQWCDPDQLRRIVAALVYDARRQRGK